MLMRAGGGVDINAETVASSAWKLTGIAHLDQRASDCACPVYHPGYRKGMLKACQDASL